MHSHEIWLSWQLQGSVHCSVLRQCSGLCLVCVARARAFAGSVFPPKSGMRWHSTVRRACRATRARFVRASAARRARRDARASRPHRARRALATPAPPPPQAVSGAWCGAQGRAQWGEGEAPLHDARTTEQARGKRDSCPGCTSLISRGAARRRTRAAGAQAAPHLSAPVRHPRGQRKLAPSLLV